MPSPERKSDQDKEVQFIQLMLEQLQGLERHVFSRDLSERVQEIVLHRDHPDKLNQQLADLNEWLDSWVITMRLRMSGDFQCQSRDYQTRAALNELGDPVDGEDLKQLLTL